MCVTEKALKTCRDYLVYLESIMRPAADEFEDRLYRNDLPLHYVFQMNLLVAHAIDHIVAMRKAMGKPSYRKSLVKEFDDIYAVKGAIFLNQKFQLVDAVNNSLKHIEIDPKMYPDLISQYGNLSFRCLQEHDGLVVFKVDEYQFDFSRVVLRPIIEVFTRWVFDEVEDVIEFALGEYPFDKEACDVDDFDDPIDQMIDYCNPTCLDCGEDEEKCRCAEFLYADDNGEFRPDWDEDFDFDAVMSRISGAYRKN